MAEFAGQFGPEGLEYPNGANAANVPYSVETLDGFVADLYTDKNRTPKSEPYFTDDLGNIYFFANPGSYNLIVADRVIPITVNLHPEEQIASGGGGGSGITKVVSSPTTLVQIVHGFSYKPAGVQSIDSLGVSVEYDTISHPSTGVTELTYGASFGPGVVHLS